VGDRLTDEEFEGLIVRAMLARDMMVLQGSDAAAREAEKARAALVDAFRSHRAPPEKATDLATAARRVLATDIGSEWKGTGTPEEAAVDALRAALRSPAVEEGAPAIELRVRVMEWADRYLDGKGYANALLYEILAAPSRAEGLVQHPAKPVGVAMMGRADGLGWPAPAAEATPLPSDAGEGRGSPPTAPRRHESGCASFVSKTCVYLRDGTKVHVRRDGKAAWLEVVPQDTIRAATPSPVSPPAPGARDIDRDPEPRRCIAVTTRRCPWCGSGRIVDGTGAFAGELLCDDCHMMWRVTVRTSFPLCGAPPAPSLPSPAPAPVEAPCAHHFGSSGLFVACAKCGERNPCLTGPAPVEAPAAACAETGADALAVDALLACEEAIFYVSELSMCSEPMLVGSLIADRDSYEKAREALAAWRRAAPSSVATGETGPAPAAGPGEGP
jgi:hypothetical protein